MGAWGVSVVENDIALDSIAGMNFIDPQGISMGFVTELLLFSKFDENVVLGAQMVLSSFTRMFNPDDYSTFFTLLLDNKTVQRHRGDAINALGVLIEKGVDAWREEKREDRLIYLKGMKGALEKCVD